MVQWWIVMWTVSIGFVETEKLWSVDNSCGYIQALASIFYKAVWFTGNDIFLCIFGPQRIVAPWRVGLFVCVWSTLVMLMSYYTSGKPGLSWSNSGKLVILVLLFIFTAQCTLVHMRGLGIACRPSVCPSVTLVDCDHIGWKSWKLIARSISPTHSLFVAKRRSTYSQGNMGKFGGD